MRVLELHAPVRVLKRSAGRSSVQMSAYITRTCMKDERTGETYDARAKGGVEFTGLVLQEDAPEWAFDRRKLWNSAELSAKRKDAQVAREMEVSMPHEFTAGQRREAALKIAHMIVRRYGGAVEFALHEPGKQSDARNRHGHFLFTCRKFDQDGGWAPKGRMEQVEGASRKKLFVPSCALDDVRKGRGQQEVESLRAEIAGIQNEIAVREKHEIFIEHLSFERRGLDRQPTQHMGKNSTAIERRGQVTDIGTKNREIAAGNQERAAVRQEIKVIQIDAAREQLNKKRQASPAPPRTQEEEYAAFYRDAYERRAVMVEAFERQYGRQEKRLRQESARLTGDIENAGFWGGLVRYVTMRHWRDKKALAASNTRLREICELRERQNLALERDRQQRLEVMKAAQTAQELERQRVAQEAPAARVAGEAPAIGLTRTEKRTQGPRPGESDRRREHFRRMGAKAKREREKDGQRRPGKAKPPSPAPAFDKATEASPTRPSKQSPRPLFMGPNRDARHPEAPKPTEPASAEFGRTAKPQPGDEAREAFFKRMRPDRELEIAAPGESQETDSTESQERPLKQPAPVLEDERDAFMARRRRRNAKQERDAGNLDSGPSFEP